MSNNTILLLIVGAVLIAVIAYYMARFLRGSLTLSLSRTAFNPGDTVTGSFDIHIKKPIEGNKLAVSLIGVQTTKTYGSGETRTHSEEVYREEVLLEEATTYTAGHTATHEFEITVPDAGAPEFMSSTLGKTLTKALRLLSNKHTRLNWRVEARLDAKGIDLTAAKTVTINMKRLG